MFMILSQQVWGENLVSWFPCVVTFRASFPLDEVLECSGSSMTLMVSNLLHLIEFLSANKVRWGSGVVWSVGISLHVRRQ